MGDLSSALSVTFLIALVEMNYQVGFAISFWQQILVPLTIVLGLTGFCVYRFRETKSLSFGQFLELRYSRSFRIFGAVLRTTSEMLANSIGPAIAANFFIYFLGLPHKIMVMGIPIPCFIILVAFVLCLSLTVILPGGRVSLLITDCFQGLISYPIFVVIAGYVILSFSWYEEITPVMFDRVDGESFLNPFDIEQLRDFNIFALVVGITSSILNRASWIGNDTSGSGRTPHEQKMAGILGAFRNGFSTLMCIMIAIAVITLLTHQKYSKQAHEIRQELSQKIVNEAVAEEDRARVNARVASLPVSDYRAGEGQPLSREDNLDTAYFDAVHAELGDDGEANLQFQKYRTLYSQMLMPVTFSNMLPVGVMGFFCLLMLMLMLSTDDSRIFNASSTIIQDIVQPFLKNPLTPQQHLRLLRVGTIAVALFFLVSSLFFVNLDYIQMFLTIMTAIWLGGAGPVMVFGLYSRFGTTAGAYASLFCGSGIAIAGALLQRNWAATVYPFLERAGWVDAIGNFLVTVSSPFNPYIVWQMDTVKFPINSMEVFFIAMISSLSAYVIVSLITFREPFNLDRMLHRGKYDIDGEKKVRSNWSLRHTFGKLIGITDEYTKGDRIIAWSVFGYAVVYQFLIVFLGAIIWNLISPWPQMWWSHYFYVTTVWVAAAVGIISTIWFLIGGLRDGLQLFKDLAVRVDNPLDNGQVVGHVSLADKAAFEAREKDKPESGQTEPPKP
ncbi:MAG: sodium:panthothenate symporter [Verrucomicrobiota bacterium]